jgi:hypothetical protein
MLYRSEQAQPLNPARALVLAERLQQEVALAQPSWPRVEASARGLLAIAGEQIRNAWRSHADKLKPFATKVFAECQDRLEREPCCLPVLTAAGDDQNITIRGLIYSKGATQDYAEECLAELSTELFATQKPKYGALVYHLLAEPDKPEQLLIVAVELVQVSTYTAEIPNGPEQLMTMVVEGSTSHAASFTGPHPQTNHDQPHLVAENPLPAYAEQVEALEQLFAGKRPTIYFGDRRYWKRWVEQAKANLHNKEPQPRGKII